MAFVRDIKERNAAPAQPPTAPTLSNPSVSGFPVVPHRSQRVSAFKRARNATGTKAPTSNSFTNDQPPAIGVVASGLAPAPPTSNSLGDRQAAQHGNEVDAMLHDVQTENADKVAAMSSFERQRELEELEESLSPGILAMLAQRAQRRLQKAQHGGGDGAEQEATAEKPEVLANDETSTSTSEQVADNAPAFDVGSKPDVEKSERQMAGM